MSDDAGAHISTAVEWNPSLLTNEPTYIDGNIETLYDNDWFQIYLKKGHVYQWTIAPSGIVLEPEDLNVMLRDFSGNWYGATVSVQAGKYKNLGWEATETGFYYLDKDADFSNHTGGYTLGLKKVSSQPIPSDVYSDDENTSGYLEVGQSIRGNIERASDKDFFKVNLIASGDSKKDSETYKIILIGETLEEQKIRLMTSKWGSIGNYQAESHSQIEEDFIEFEYQPWYGSSSNIY